MSRQLCKRALAVVAALVVAVPGVALAADQISQQQQAWETKVGQQQYMQLVQQGKIVPQSPLYEQLEPIAKRIAAVADQQYFAPFHFLLVNSQSPNAFAVPGGNVYVTTGMLSFVQNEDELAGVLCHEVNHDIHHDVYNDYRKDQHVQTEAGILGALMGLGAGYYGGYGGAYLGQMAAGVGATAQVDRYSRAVESAADKAGAYTCAQAGFNPWGLVWLLRRMEAQPSTGTHSEPEWLSDHPKDDHRVADLIQAFNADLPTFGKYRDDVTTGTPLPKITSAQAPTRGYGYGGYPQQQGAPYPYPQQQGAPYPYPQQQGAPYPYPQQQYPGQPQGAPQQPPN